MIDLRHLELAGEAVDEVVDGRVHLGVRDGLLADAVHLGQDQRNGVPDRGRLGLDVARERAGEAPAVGEPAALAVGQAFVRADLHGDPRGERAAAQDEVHHLDREVIGVGVLQAQVADVDVALVDGLLDEVDAGLGRRECLAERRELDRAVLPAGGPLVDLGLEVGLGEVARGGQDDVLGEEVLGVDGLQVGGREGFEALLARLPGQGAVAVEDLLELPAQHGARLVVDLAQAFDLADLGQVQGRLAELGVHQDVEEQVQPLVQVLAQDVEGQGRGPVGRRRTTASRPGSRGAPRWPPLRGSWCRPGSWSGS